MFVVFCGTSQIYIGHDCFIDLDNSERHTWKYKQRTHIHKAEHKPEAQLENNPIHLISLVLSLWIIRPLKTTRNILAMFVMPTTGAELISKYNIK